VGQLSGAFRVFSLASPCSLRVRKHDDVYACFAEFLHTGRNSVGENPARTASYQTLPSCRRISISMSSALSASGMKSRCVVARHAPATGSQPQGDIEFGTRHRDRRACHQDRSPLCEEADRPSYRIDRIPARSDQERAHRCQPIDRRAVAAKSPGHRLQSCLSRLHRRSETIASLWSSESVSTLCSQRGAYHPSINWAATRSARGSSRLASQAFSSFVPLEASPSRNDSTLADTSDC